jgi:phage terminase large subunit-like protein
MTNLPTWVFDDSPIDDPLGHGERAVKFLRLLKHPKSRAAGRKFQLPRWQERIVRKIYGPCHEDGRRIVRTVVMLLPRGNRKTSLAAALALLHAIGPEQVPHGQIVCAASDREQARIAFDEAQGICREDRRIGSKIHFLDSQHRFTHIKSGSVFRAISCDAARAHGGTPTFALVDELHAWLKRDLWDVLRTGLVKTPGSLLCVITTAGRGQENVAWDIVDYARKVARGEIDDPATLPILFEADRDCDWQDEAIWRQVNPGLANGFPDIAGLRQLAVEAKNRPADREAFRQLHLNIWLDHSHDPFVDMSVYDKGADPIDLEALKGQPCWLAVDLSSNSDLTVIVACWKIGERFIVRCWYFCPENNLRARADRDSVPYPTWAEAGHITPTSGNVVDFHAVEQQIRDICEMYPVREIAFDPHLARNSMNTLLGEGYPCVDMRQGWVTMAPAIKELERAVIGGNFQHGGHPILRWNFDNIAVKTDTAGNRMFAKDKSKDKIDGAVASAMAVARAAAGAGGTIYDDPNFDPQWMVLE